ANRDRVASSTARAATPDPGRRSTSRAPTPEATGGPKGASTRRPTRDTGTRRRSMRASIRRPLPTARATTAGRRARPTTKAAAAGVGPRAEGHRSPRSLPPSPRRSPSLAGIAPFLALARAGGDRLRSAPVPKDHPDSPLIDAATALDAELRRFEDLS